MQLRLYTSNKKARPINLTMRLATELIGVPSARPSASSVAPPPSDDPVASPLYREKASRLSTSAVAPQPSIQPVASPIIVKNQHGLPTILQWPHHPASNPKLLHSIASP